MFRLQPDTPQPALSPSAPRNGSSGRLAAATATIATAAARAGATIASGTRFTAAWTRRPRRRHRLRCRGRRGRSRRGRGASLGTRPRSVAFRRAVSRRRAAVVRSRPWGCSIHPVGRIRHSTAVAPLRRRAKRRRWWRRIALASRAVRARHGAVDLGAAVGI